MMMKIIIIILVWSDRRMSSVSHPLDDMLLHLFWGNKYTSFFHFHFELQWVNLTRRMIDICWIHFFTLKNKNDYSLIFWGRITNEIETTKPAIPYALQFALQLFFTDIVNRDYRENEKLSLLSRLVDRVSK